MKRRLWCIVFSLFACAVFARQQLPDPAVFPRDVYVGDAAELVFYREISVPEKIRESGLTIPGDRFTESDLYRVESVSITWQDAVAEIRVRFVSWTTGVIEFPAIESGYGIIDFPPVTIVSILERDGISSPAPARSPLLIPGTTWMLYGFILGFLLCVGGALFFAARIRRWLLDGPAKRSAARRYRAFLRTLRFLARRSQKAESVWWYGKLSYALKWYLGLYFFADGSSLLSRTGTELVAYVLTLETNDNDTDSAAGHAAGVLEELFTDIDRVRFSGAEDGMLRTDLLETAGSFVDTMEEVAHHDIS